MRRRLGLAAVLASLVAAAAVLHGLGRHFPVSSLRGDSLEVALAAAARLVGLAVVYWLLASSALFLAARLAAIPAAVRALAPLTWRPMRKLVESSVASTLVWALSTQAGAALTPGYVPVPAGDPPTTTTSATSTTVEPPTTTTAGSPPREELAPSQPPATVYLPIATPRPTPTVTALPAIEVVVRPGDNMWFLAERRLQEALGAVGDEQIAPYWLAVIAANKDRIRSGDLDLIFPGEVLVLPEWG